MATLHDTETPVHTVDDRAVIDLRDDIVRIDLSTEAAGDIVVDLTEPNPYTSGYHRSPEQCDRLQHQILELIEPSVVPASGLLYLVIDGTSPLADWNRSLEMRQGWGDMPTYMNGYEHASIAVVVVDFLRSDGPLITQAGRAVRGSHVAAFSCGSQVVDSLSGRVDPAEVAASLGIESMRSCWDVTTFISVPGLARSERFPVGYGVMNYLGVTRQALAAGVTHFPCYVNDETRRSFERMGLQAHQILDRDLEAPLVDGYEYNRAFTAAVVPVAEMAATLFGDDHPLAAFIRPFRQLEMPVVEIRAGRR